MGQSSSAASACADMSAAPSQEAHCRVTLARNFSGSSTFTVYTVEVSYKGFQWQIHRRFNAIRSVYNAVRKVCHLAVLEISAQALSWCCLQATQLYNPPTLAELPVAPWFHDKLSPGVIEARLDTLRFFFAYLVNCAPAWHSAPKAMTEFFELSPGVSLDAQLGRKGMEGWMHKEMGGRFVAGGSPLIQRAQRRWFVLKDAALAWFVRSYPPPPQSTSKNCGSRFGSVRFAARFEAVRS
jgi:hypothetical protein